MHPTHKTARMQVLIILLPDQLRKLNGGSAFTRCSCHSGATRHHRSWHLFSPWNIPPSSTLAVKKITTTGCYHQHAHIKFFKTWQFGCSKRLANDGKCGRVFLRKGGLRCAHHKSMRVDDRIHGWQTKEPNWRLAGPSSSEPRWRAKGIDYPSIAMRDHRKVSWDPM